MSASGVLASRWVVLALAVAPALAWADEALTVAVHPLVVPDGDDAEVTRLRAIAGAAWSTLPLTLIDQAKVRTYFEKQGGAGCDAAKEQDECLGALAKGVRAQVTLMVSMSAHAPNVVVFGKVVRRDGTIASSAKKEYARGPQPPDDAALGNFLAGFVRNELSFDAGSELVALSPSVPGEETAAPGKAWSVPGLALGVGGVIAVGVATVFEFEAAASWRQYQTASGTQPSVSPTALAELRTIKGRAEAQQTLGAVLFGVGAVALAGGGYLLATHVEPAAAARLSVVPGGLMVSGSFP
jgi:hypothetical protein